MAKTDESPLLFGGLKGSSKPSPLAIRAGSKIGRWINLGVLVTDSEALRARKAGMTLMAFAGVAASFVLGLYEMWSGYLPGLLITWSFAGLGALSLWFFRVTKWFTVFRFFQLATILFFPFIVHYLKGGFSAGGACMIWALGSPIGAALFQGFRKSLSWFAAYLGLTVGFAFLETHLASGAPPLWDKGSGILFASHIGGISLVIFLTIHYFHYRLRQEQRKSERLLLNILPQEIIVRLKKEPKVIADSFPEATILFTDLVGFTALASSMTAVRLVEILNRIVSSFDRLSSRFGLEKIKTIGDAYLLVGGVPTPRPDHAEAVARCAIEMRKVIGQLAGTEGLLRKFTFDLWGDSVNIASRMESTCEPDQIQVSSEMRSRLGDRFLFSPVRQVQAKGKGTLPAYFLLGEA
ncbi:adenylate/guanylate cyclase domain-containing protein [bacterium]|nr:adenylate/guanylate cyclase domain-containing protein [bacterium]